MPSGFRGPLRYRKDGHFLDLAPLEAVDRLSIISEDATKPRFNWFATDFVIYAGPNTAGEAGGWLLTETAAGAGNAQRVDVDDSATFGVLKLLTDNGDDDAEILQLVGEPWKYVKGKRMWFAIRVKVSDADDGEAFFGLAISDISPIATLPSDGFFFEKAETATKFDFHVRQDAVSTEKTSIDTAVIADDTFHEYAFQVDVEGNIHVYYDGVEVTVASVPASDANIPDDEDLTLHLAIQTGAAAAKSMSIDYILIAQER